MRVVGYVRVSTQGQVEDGFGLDVQRTAIKAWPRRSGHRLATIHADEGVSGTLAAAERPGLTAALRAVRERQVDGLAVHRLDRLARILTVQEATLAAVWSHGGCVFEVVTGEVPQDDPDDPMRTAIRQVMGVFAQLERATVVARMRAGRAAKAERGGYVGGAPRYGWKAEDGNLATQRREQRALRRAQELRLDGQSYRQIAQVLAAEGHKPKRSGAWHPETLRRMLARE